MSLPPYFRLSTEVQVEFQAGSTSEIAPQPACVIGPHFKVFDVEDSGDRALLGLGAYDKDQDVEFD
jgi:hypothetical protein